MLSFLFLFGIAETNICFYKSDDKKCPDTYTSYSLDNFNKFKETKYNDDSYSFLITTDMSSKYTIDFSNLESSSLSIVFKSSESDHSIYLDFSQKKVFNLLNINSINVNSESTTIDSKITTLILERSRFLNIENLTASNIHADTLSLINANEIKADQLVFEVLSEGYSVNETVRANLNVNENSIVQFKVLSSPTISLIDSTFYFGEQISFNFEQTEVKSITIAINETSKETVYFQTVTRSSNTVFPTINFSLGPQNTLRFVNSNLPIITSPQQPLFASISGKSGIVEIESEFAPFSIDGEKMTVILRTQKVQLLGPLFVRDSVNIQCETVSKADLHLTSVVIASESGKNSQFTSQGEISVHITQIQSLANSTKCSFTGETALYDVSLFPTAEICSLEFSNFVIQKETKYAINYILGESSFLSIGTAKGDSSLQIVANFIGGSTTASEVDSHFDEELELFELQGESSISISLTFPRHNTKGFNSATHIYSAQQQGQSKASIKLDHHLDAFNNYLCIVGTTQECPEGSQVFENAKDFEGNWMQYLRETAEDIYFYFRLQYTNLVNFSKFIQNDNHPNVYFESKAVILDQHFIQGELGTITVNGTAVQGTSIVINRFESPVMLISPLEFYNVMIAAHSIETINCTKLPYLKVDPLTLAKYPQKCAPNYLVLENFDEYTKFDFKEDSVVLNGDDDSVSEVTLLITQESRPFVNLTTKAKSVTFSSSTSEEEKMKRSKAKKNDKKYLSVFSHFEMTSPQQTINSNLTDIFDGSIDVHNFNGLLNVISPNGQVPLNFVNASHLEIQSENDVKTVNYLSINGNLDLSKSDVSTTVYDAHFGPSFQLTDNEKHGLRIRKGFFDSRQKQVTPEINGQLTLEGSMYVNSSTTLLAKGFSVDSAEEPTITISYRLSEIPYIDLGSFASNSNAKIIFQYDESDRYGQYDEAEFTMNFTSYYYLDTEVPVICGTGLNCSALDVEFKSSIPQFNGESSIVQALCSYGEKECVSLRLETTVPSPTPIPSPDDHNKITTKTIIIVSVTSGVIIVFCAIIFISSYCSKKKKALLDSQKLLASTY